jgi:hypothetical protein
MVLRLQAAGRDSAAYHPPSGTDTIPPLPPGEYRLLVRSIGFQGSEDTIRAQPGDVWCVTTRLVHAMGTRPATDWTLTPLYPQNNFEIRGQIVDAGDGAGISGAEVSLPDLTVSTVADSNGGFVLRGHAPPGCYQGIVRKIGFRQVFTEVRIEPPQGKIASPLPLERAINGDATTIHVAGPCVMTDSSGPLR